MKWIKKILNKLFKHLYLTSVAIFSVSLIVLLIVMSAQFLGDRISSVVLNNRSVEVDIVVDKALDKEYSMKKLEKAIEEDYDLKKHNIKIKLVDIKDDINKSFSKGKIIFSNEKDTFLNFISKHKISILERSTFPDRSRMYLEFSKYDEYVVADTVIDNLRIYIGIVDAETNLEKTKINRTLSAICNSILLKSDLQPD